VYEDNLVPEGNTVTAALWRNVEPLNTGNYLHNDNTYGRKYIHNFSQSKKRV